MVIKKVKREHYRIIEVVAAGSSRVPWDWGDQEMRLLQNLSNLEGMPTELKPRPLRSGGLGSWPWFLRVGVMKMGL